MGNFKPSQYDIKNALQEVHRYEGIFVGDNYTIKDHGDYVQINIDADNKKGHISYDLYFDDNGKLIKWIPHRSN